MTKIFSYTSNKSGLGVGFRLPTAGPELCLVEDFLKSGLPDPDPGQELTVLLEPNTGGSYPDILVIYWNLSRIKNIDQKRNKMSRQDLRIFHYILNNPGSSKDNIRELFGRRFGSSLKHLCNEGIAYRRGERFYIYKKFERGVVDRLVAIEAKIDDWKEGIRQASSLCWITDERYLLITDKRSREKIISAASEFGVGVIFQGDCLKKSVSSQRRPYGYWYINEEILSYKGLVTA